MPRATSDFGAHGFAAGSQGRGCKAAAAYAEVRLCCDIVCHTVEGTYVPRLILGLLNYSSGMTLFCIRPRLLSALHQYCCTCKLLVFFTVLIAARCYASAAYVVVMQCLCVHLSICLSHLWILSKRINISSKIFDCRFAKPFYFFHTKQHGNIPMGTPSMGASTAGGVTRNNDFEPISGFSACC